MKTKLRFVAMPCFRCGRNGHYADECFARSNKNGKSLRDEEDETCFRCGRQGHYADECFARTNKNGKSLRDEDDETCFRCGRQGHWVDECYARNHIDGRPLSITSATKTDGPGVYALLYANGKVYVGKANGSVSKRVRQHMQRGVNAAQCTANWGAVVQQLPLITTGDASDLESWERAETLARMRAMSVDGVRGWRYVASALSPDVIADATAQLRERFDACRRCETDGCVLCTTA